MTTCLRAWMVLNEVASGRDARADPGEVRDLTRAGLLESASPSPHEGTQQDGIESLREELSRLHARQRELDTRVRSMRSKLLVGGHSRLYRTDGEYRSSWDELQTLEEKQRMVRTRIVQLVQDTADEATTGTVDGEPVRVTFKGRELLDTLEPRLARVGGMEVEEFQREMGTIHGHFKTRAARARRILRRVASSFKGVDEIHLRLAAVGLSGRPGDPDEAADLFVQAWKGLDRRRGRGREDHPAWVSLAETIALVAGDAGDLDNLVARANGLLRERWNDAFMPMDEVRAAAIVLSCRAETRGLLADAVSIAREECPDNPGAAAFLACAVRREGAHDATRAEVVMDFRFLRDNIAGEGSDRDQAVTGAALMAAAGLHTEAVLARYREALVKLESFDGASMELPASMVAILPVTVAEALDNVRLASSCIYGSRLSLGGVENLSLGVKMLMHSAVLASDTDRRPDVGSAAPQVLALTGVPAAAVLTVAAGLLAFHALSLHELAVRDYRFHPVHSHYVYG